MVDWFRRKRRESQNKPKRAHSARLNFTPLAYRQLAAVLERQPGAARCAFWSETPAAPHRNTTWSSSLPVS
jgi:hypothetical protein